MAFATHTLFYLPRFAARSVYAFANPAAVTLLALVGQLGV